MRRLAALCALLLLLLPAGPAAAQEPESRITYLYVTACQSCARVRELLSSLPEEIEAADGAGGTVRTRLVLDEVNIATDLAAAQALFSRYGVPEDDQMAPTVFLRDTYLAGAEAILSALPDALAAGDALATGASPATGAPLADGAEPPAGAAPLAGVAPLAGDAQQALGLGATVLAGLVGGLNPCALSMLLVLLSALMTAGRGAGRYAAVYLGVKGACYYLIGTVFLAAFSAADAGWLPGAVRILATAVSAVLIALNLLDAANALRARYGAVRNQLPAPLRGGLSRYIRRTVRSHPGGLALAVAGAGVLVSFSEFMCAGQVYLATLLSALHAGVEPGRMALLLLAYCLSFLAPSALVAGFAVRAGGTLETSDLLRRHMPLVKLLTALLLAGTTAYLWRP